MHRVLDDGVDGLVGVMMVRGVRAPLISKARPRADAAPVVCMGDSITRGMGSANWVDQLQRRFPDRVVVNGGVNGNLAWNLLQRLDDVVRLAPSVVVVLIGTNDLLARESTTSAERYRKRQHLPDREPSLEWYVECLDELIGRLQHETSARILVAEVPPLGEDLDNEQNDRVTAYNAALHRVCRERAVEVLSLYARLSGVLNERSAAPMPFRWSDLSTITSVLRYWVARHSWDRIARSRRLTVLTDHVHLSDRGGAVMCDLVTEAIAEGNAS